MRMLVLFFIKIKILINKEIIFLFSSYENDSFIFHKNQNTSNKAMISLFSSHENASCILHKNQNTNKQGDYFLVQLI